MKNLKYVFSYGFVFKKHIFVGLLYSFLVVLFTLATAGILMPILGLLFGSQERVIVPPVWDGLFGMKEYFSNLLNYQITTSVDTYGAVSVLGWISLLAVLLFFLKNLFRYLSLYTFAYIKNGIIRLLRETMFEKTIHFNISYFNTKNRGDVIAKFSSDISQVQFSFISFFEIVFRDPFLVILSLILLCVINLQLTIFIFIMLPIMGGLIAVIGNNLKKDSRLGQEEEGKVISHIEELINGLKIVKIFNASTFFMKNFKKTNEQWMTINNKVIRKTDLGSPSSEFFGVLLFIMILWYGGRLVLTTDTFLKPHVFLTYLMLLFQIVQPTKNIVSLFYGLRKGEASAERIRNYLEHTDFQKSKPNAIKIDEIKESIEFRNVSFKYPESDKYAIKDFNLKIKKGESVALVGPSGGGKTSIINLITRFYEHQEGQILIDGVEIKDIDLQSLRNVFGYVSQDPILFNQSIKDNLILGKPDISENDVNKALEIAYLKDFVDTLPDGIETIVGYMGSKLSGGQKQRLSIARSMIHKPQLLVFDEATSALDNESEYYVQKALENSLKFCTSIVIAHRLTTIRAMDTIAVIENGTISEKGTHDQLMANKGVYFSLQNYSQVD